MFTIEMSSPFRSGWRGGLGGPNSGGHQQPHWYIQYGMDLGVATGTEIFAAFDGRITRFSPHRRSSDTSKVYGAQLFVRYDNNKMGGFYTHFTDSSPNIRQGQAIIKRRSSGENASRPSSLRTCRDHRGSSNGALHGCRSLQAFRRVGGPRRYDLGNV